jgi:hypothetical protein
MTDTETKLCPACAEEIKAAAVRCKHCGENLEAKPGPGSTRHYNIGPALLLLLGIALFGYAMTMDVTVDSGTSYGRVANIHLIAQQSNYRNGGAVMALAGLIWGVLGSRGPRRSRVPAALDAIKVPGQDWDSKLSAQQKQILALALGTVIFLSLLYLYASAR